MFIKCGCTYTTSKYHLHNNYPTLFSISLAILELYLDVKQVPKGDRERYDFVYCVTREGVDALSSFYHYEAINVHSNEFLGSTNRRVLPCEMTIFGFLAQVILCHHFILYTEFMTITFRLSSKCLAINSNTEGSKSKSEFKLNHHTFITIHFITKTQ